MTPTMSVAANAWKSRLSSATTRLPFVTIAAIPLTTNDIASVPMSGLIRKRVTIIPFTIPTARPTASPARMPTGVDTDVRGRQRDRAREPVDRPDRQVDPAGDEDERARHRPR